MKYRYMKRSVNQHLFRKPTKRSRQLHKLALLIILNMGVTTTNVNLFQELMTPTKLVFVNPSIAKAAGHPVTVDATTSEETANPAQAPADLVSTLIERTFPSSDVQLAKAIAYAESRHIPTKASDLDIMQDGRPFSIGVFQVNLTWHTLNGVKCYEAFDGKSYKAVVVDEDLYATCVRLAEDPAVNIKTAFEIYERSGDNFGRWSTFTNEAYIPFLKLF